jgi:hypothetical protein
VLIGGKGLEGEVIIEIMDRLKMLNNDELNRTIQYCKIMKKANDLKEGKKATRRKRTKNPG